MKKRILSLIVTLAMLLTLGIPSIALSPADYTDLPDKSHFTYNGIVSAIENGIMQGVGGGIFAPNSVITRAEAAIYLVNVMGATVKASLTNVTDINPDAWYAKDGRLAVAVQMGVISPVNGKLRPDDLVTREEAFDMTAKVIQLTSNSWNLTRFEDRAEVSSTYARSIQALVNGGYIQGVPAANGKFNLNPKGTMTRGEFATLFGNVFQGFVSGSVSSVKSGNVVVKKAGTVLKNLTVKGDLIIGDGVGNGDVTLDNVKVEGRLVVRGGGKNSIIITGGSVISEVVVSRVDGAVRVTVVGNSSVQAIYVNDGKDNVIIDGDVGSVRVDSDVPVTLQGGTVGAVTVNAPNAEVNLAADSKVEALRVQAPDVTIDTERGSQITNLTVTSNGDNAEITGRGAITTAQINADDVSIESKPATTITGVGVTGTTVGGSQISGGTTTGSSQSGNQNGNNEDGDSQGGNGNKKSNIIIESVEVRTFSYPTAGTIRPNLAQFTATSNDNNCYWSSNYTIGTSVNNDNLNYDTPVAAVTGITWERLDGSPLAADGKFSNNLYKAIITVTAKSGYSFDESINWNWGYAGHINCGVNCGHRSISKGTIVSNTTMTIELCFGPAVSGAHIIANNQVKIWLSDAITGLTAADFNVNVSKDNEYLKNVNKTITDNGNGEYTLTLDTTLDEGDYVSVSASESSTTNNKLLGNYYANSTFFDVTAFGGYFPELAGLSFDTANYKLNGFDKDEMAIYIGNNWYPVSADLTQNGSLKELVIPGINNGEPFNLFSYYGGSSISVAKASYANSVLVDVNQATIVSIPIPRLAWCENWSCVNFAANKDCTQSFVTVDGDDWYCGHYTCAVGYNAADHVPADCDYYYWHFKCDGLNHNNKWDCGDHWKCMDYFAVYGITETGIGFCDTLADCGDHYKCHPHSYSGYCDAKADCGDHYKCSSETLNGLCDEVCSECGIKRCDPDYYNFSHFPGYMCIPNCDETDCSLTICYDCNGVKCPEHCGVPHP